MKSLYRMLGAVSHETINEALAKIVQDLEITRNKKRREVLETIEKLNVKDDAEKIQYLLIELNRDLTSSYEKEKCLLEFLNIIKS